MKNNMRQTIYMILIAWCWLMIGFNLSQTMFPPTVDTTPVIHIEKTENVYMYDGIARVTCYGPTGYRTASMKVPAHGMVASSDRTIPLGTKVIIEGYGEMVVEDRTAKWVHEKHGFTLDIFMQEGCDMNFGVKRLGYKFN